MKSSTLRRSLNKVTTRARMLVTFALTLLLVFPCLPSPHGARLIAKTRAPHSHLAVKTLKSETITKVNANNVGGSSSAQESPPKKTPKDPNQPHLLAASYYSVENNLTATLMLLNQTPEPITAEPRLYSTFGERLRVPAVTIEPHMFRSIDLGKLVAKSGPSFRQGNVQVLYRGADLALGGVVQMVDHDRSLIFDEELSDVRKWFFSSHLEGVWWLPSRKHEIRLAVTNTTNKLLAATVSVDGSVPRQKEPLALSLAPHETRVMDLQQDVVGRRGGILSKAGGISLEHGGSAGALVARAFVEDASEGYSSVVEFYDPRRTLSNQLHGAGLRLGEAAGEKLSSTLVARNVGDVETIVTGRLPYSRSDGSTGVLSLPEQKLEPGETISVDLTKAAKLDGVTEDLASAGLEFEYTGQPGSVIMAAVSVTKGGNHVFRLPMVDPTSQKSSAGGYPWMIEGDSSTLVHVKNATDRDQQYTMYLSFPGGVYSLGMRTLAGRQTMSLDIRSLRDSQAPDATGLKIPINATHGRLSWSLQGPNGRVLIGRAEQVDLAQGLSTTSACGVCCQNSYYDSWGTPAFWNPVIGTNTQYQALLRERDCYNWVTPAVNYYPGTWASSSWIMSMNSMSGVGTANAAGAVNLSASWTAYQYDEFSYPDPCVATAIGVAIYVLSEIVDTPCTVTIQEQTISGPNPPVRNPATIRRLFAPVFEATPNRSNCQIRWSLTGPGTIQGATMGPLVTVNGNAVGNVVLRATNPTTGSFGQTTVPVVNQREVSVRVYIVRNTSGSVAAATQTRVNNDIANANLIWEQCGIKFNLVSTSFINSDTFLDPPDSPTRTLLRNQASGTNAIEVYYVRNLLDEPGTTGITTSDGVIISTGAGANFRTVAHEMGHAMGLPGNPHRTGTIANVSLMWDFFSTTNADLILDECNSLSRFTSN